jgi:DNA-binding transcriptional MerR regulator
MNKENAARSKENAYAGNAGRAMFIYAYSPGERPLETSPRTFPWAELSRATGIQVATIKFYLRERPLPAGERSGPKQSRYGEEHLRRLRLVRGLLEVGGLSLATARGVVDAVDSEIPLAHPFGVAQRSVSAEIDPGDIAPEGPGGHRSADRGLTGFRGQPGPARRRTRAGDLRITAAAGRAELVLPLRHGGPAGR